MFNRYLSFRRGGALLTEVANFCLTKLEDMVKNIKWINESRRKTAFRYFQIDFRVLSETGRLHSTNGGPMEARKGSGVVCDLTSYERLFPDEAIKNIIRRAAEKADGLEVELPIISLSDLPAI